MYAKLIEKPKGMRVQMVRYVRGVGKRCPDVFKRKTGAQQRRINTRFYRVMCGKTMFFPYLNV